MFLGFTQFILKWMTFFVKSHNEKLNIQILIAKYNMINHKTLDKWDFIFSCIFSIRYEEE